MNFYKKLAELEAETKPFAIATVVHASDNSPGRTAFKMCVTEEGEVFGSIGGGALEYGARNTALDMLRTGERTKIITYHLTEQELGGIGMACGGEAQVFIETVMPRKQLVIFGAGHIGSALTRYANDVGFDVTLVDDRPEFASCELHPDANRIYCCDYEDAFRLDFPQNAYFVIVTHQHIGDGTCLLGLLKHPELHPKYIGLIGSSKKLAKSFEKLMEDGISREALEFVHAPIGIDHGGQSANEIAISIVTELIAVRYDKKLVDAMSAKKHPLMNLT